MSERHYNSRADNPASQGNLVRGDHTRPIGGAISRATRSRAGQLYEQNLDLLELIFERFREGDPNVKARDVHEALDKAHKWAGGEIVKHAMVDSEGRDLAPVRDDAALDALLAARQSERLALPPTETIVVRKGEVA